MFKWIKITGVVALVGVLFYLGFAIGQITFEPKVVEVKVPEISYITVTETETVLVPYEVIKEVISYITIVEKEPVEVITYRNIYPRDFTSVANFKEWYEAQGFLTLFPNAGEADSADCDDYSVRLQREALEQGYSISQAFALDGEYYGVKVTDETDGHAGNLVLIGHTYYWVEPQPDKFEVIKVCDRD